MSDRLDAIKWQEAGKLAIQLLLRIQPFNRTQDGLIDQGYEFLTGLEKGDRTQDDLKLDAYYKGMIMMLDDLAEGESKEDVSAPWEKRETA